MVCDILGSTHFQARALGYFQRRALWPRPRRGHAGHVGTWTPASGGWPPALSILWPILLPVISDYFM